MEELYNFECWLQKLLASKHASPIQKCVCVKIHVMCLVHGNSFGLVCIAPSFQPEWNITTKRRGDNLMLYNLTSGINLIICKSCMQCRTKTKHHLKFPFGLKLRTSWIKCRIGLSYNFPTALFINEAHTDKFLLLFFGSCYLFLASLIYWRIHQQSYNHISVTQNFWVLLFFPGHLYIISEAHYETAEYHNRHSDKITICIPFTHTSTTMSDNDLYMGVAALFTVQTLASTMNNAKKQFELVLVLVVVFPPHVH